MDIDRVNPLICCFCDKNLSIISQEDVPKTSKGYKCPACERKYCSADCCKGHKEKFDCSGTRNKTPYVSLSQFDQKQFLDDYFFLEGINQNLERNQRKTVELLKTRHNNSNSKKRHGRKRKNRKTNHKIQSNHQVK